MQQPMVHLYTGEGKGKTTAAMGLALRALGNEKKVVISAQVGRQEPGHVIKRFGGQLVGGHKLVTVGRRDGGFQDKNRLRKVSAPQHHVRCNWQGHHSSSPK